MKIVRADAAELKIEDFSLLPWLVYFPASLFILYKVAARFYAQRLFDGDFFGALAAGLAFLFAVAVFGERSTFCFRRQERRVVWSRKGLLGRKGGVLPFAQIRKALIQTGRSSEQSGTCRVTLLTDAGELPLSRFYHGGEKGKCEEIARAIRTVLEQRRDSLIEDSIVELVVAGNKIEAVKLAREHYGMSLTEARSFVEKLSE